MRVSKNVAPQCRLIVIACVTLLAAASSVLGARVQLSPEAVQAWLEDSGLIQEQQSVGRRSSESGSLWFGPRLGRRRRSPPEDEESLLSVEPITAETIMELLQRDAPWTVIALREYPSGKRQTLTFTPRLGRDMDEATSELLSTVGLRTPPFSPRLGRGNGLPFSPRLGRQQQQATTARVGHEEQH